MRTLIELVRAGENPRCVDCGDTPFGGGMWCVECFGLNCERRAAEQRARGELHECGRHGFSLACYNHCKCRCEGCRAAKAAHKSKAKQ